VKCNECGKEIIGEKYIEINDYIHERAWVFCSLECFFNYDDREFGLDE